MKPTKKNRNNKSKPGSSAQTAGKANVRIWIWLALSCILITTLAIYFKVLHYGLLYTWDDNLYITENKDITALHFANIKKFFTTFYVANYQPVTMLTYAVDYLIGGRNPLAFHLTSILLHLLNTLLVFVLVRKISPTNVWVALVTAAFFGVHPMHVESVAWVAERKDVLYSFFFLLSLIMYADYLKIKNAGRLLSAALFFILSCLSKSAAVALPLVMLLFDYYTGQRFGWKQLLEKVPFFAISLLFGIIAIISQRSGIQEMAPQMKVVEHSLVVSYSFVAYIFKALVPLQLSAVYPYPAELGANLPVFYYLSVCVVAVLLFFVWCSRKWGKEVIFGFLFFVATIILVLQIIPVGAASMADRYTYMPYFGLFFILGTTLVKITGTAKASLRKFRIPAFFFVFVCFTIFASTGYSRTKAWKNDYSLFTDVIDKYPHCSVSYYNRGSYYLDFYAQVLYADNPEKRKFYIENSINDFENSLRYTLTQKKKAGAYYNLGTAKAALGLHKEALADFNKTIEINPAYYKVYVNRGNTLIALGNYKGAFSDLNIAVSKTPPNPLILSSRAMARYALSDTTGAIKDLDLAIKTDPTFSDAFINMGIIKDDLKDYKGALNDYNKGLELNPGQAAAYSNRGVTKIKMGDIEGACEDFCMAVQLGYSPASQLIDQYCKKKTAR